MTPSPFIYHYRGAQGWWLAFSSFEARSEKYAHVHEILQWHHRISGRWTICALFLLCCQMLRMTAAYLSHARPPRLKPGARQVHMAGPWTVLLLASVIFMSTFERASGQRKFYRCTMWFSRNNVCRHASTQLSYDVSTHTHEMVNTRHCCFRNNVSLA